MRKKAMILAAGLGTRLGGITTHQPKILIDIGGITLLEWITRKMVAHGFKDIIINTHHCADMIQEKAPVIAKRTGASFTFSDERENLLDTGGGLFHARNFFDREPFLLYNGDIVTDLDLTELYSHNIATGAIATLALREREAKRVFLVDNDGRLAGWLNRKNGERIMIGGSREKESSGNSFGGNFLIREIPFTAISVVNPQIFRYMEAGVYSMRDVYLKATASDLVNTYDDGGGFWIDIGSPVSLERCRDLLQGSKSDFEGNKSKTGSF